MRKIVTLFRRDPDDMRRVLREVHPDATWVTAGEGVATRKFDGTCTMRDDRGYWWARREVKPGKTAPPGWVEVDRDEATGKAVGWETLGQAAHWAAFRAVADPPTTPGTYELCGPKVNGNPEGFADHVLVPHGAFILRGVPVDYDGLAAYLADLPYEGVVWHHPSDGRMVKIKRRDFLRELS